MLREGSIKSTVLKYAKKNKMLVYQHGAYYVGFPDTMIICTKEIFFIEFKAEKKRLSVMQEYIVDLFAKYNKRVFVIDNVKDGKKLIDEMM